MLAKANGKVVCDYIGDELGGKRQKVKGKGKVFRMDVGVRRPTRQDRVYLSEDTARYLCY